MCCSSSARRGVDRLAHLLEGTAATDIGDRLVYIPVGRLRLLLEQRRHCHDHSALAVTALRNVVLDPGLLHLMQCTATRKALYGGDLFASSLADSDATGARRHAVDMHRAGATLCDTAAILGAGQPDILADRP